MGNSPVENGCGLQTALPGHHPATPTSVLATTGLEKPRQASQTLLKTELLAHATQALQPYFA
jgi:hypothetical protein